MEETKQTIQSSQTVPNQTPPPSAPPPTQPQANPFFKLTKPVLIGLGAIILLVSAFTSYFVLVSNQEKKVSSNQQTVPTPTPDPTAISNWKTYTNTKYGFSFKYPPSWEVEEGLKSANSLLRLYLTSPDYTPPKNPYEGDEGKGYIVSLDVSQNDYRHEYNSFMEGSPDFYKKAAGNIILDGVSGLQAQIINGLGGFKGKVIFVPFENSQAKSLSINLETFQANSENVLDQILSTFKFTESIDVSSWKTYTTNEFLDIDSTMLKKFPNFKTRRMAFKYPHWLEINKVDLTIARADYAKTIVNLGFDLINREYQTSHGGPNDYSVGLLFTFATVPEGTKAFDKTFWGESIDSQISRIEEKNINGFKATFAYSPYSPTPTGVIFHLSKTEQVYVLVSFFTFDGDCKGERCKTIVKEIDQILSTFKFTN